MAKRIAEATEGLDSKQAHKSKGELKERLHEMMDGQLAAREEIVNRAQTKQDTTTMWKLISSSLEVAFIEFPDLKQQDASTMRGRGTVRIETTKQNMK